VEELEDGSVVAFGTRLSAAAPRLELLGARSVPHRAFIRQNDEGSGRHAQLKRASFNDREVIRKDVPVIRQSKQLIVLSL
jgi:hypothetical protein